MSAKFVSTFISYSSRDKRLVHDIVTELGMWGVLAWLDEHSLIAGDALGETLPQAIDEQEFFTVILTDAAAQSDWVRREIERALSQKAGEKILVVGWGDQSHARINAYAPLAQWVAADHKTIVVDDADAKSAAEKIARSIFARMKLNEARKVALYLDQRGSGLRQGPPPAVLVPEELVNDSTPILIWRPDRRERLEFETIYGSSWEAALNRLGQALSLAFNPFAGKEIHLCGDGQLSLAWAVGNMLNDKSRARLHCHSVRDGASGFDPVFRSVLNNELPTPASPASWTQHRLVESQPPSTDSEKLAVYLGPPRYLHDAIDYVRECPEAEIRGARLVWHEYGWFREQHEVEQFLSALRDLLQRERKDGVREVHFLNCLPFHVTPLVSASLFPGRWHYHELRRDLENSLSIPKPADRYTHLTVAYPPHPRS